jgi:uncharacterized protein DUF4124
MGSQPASGMGRSLLGTIGCALMMIAVQPALAAEMYKTIDPNGVVVYSDHPLSPASQRISLQVSEPNQQEAARLSKEQAVLAADAAQQAKQSQHDAEEQKKKAEQDAQQKQRCEAARNRYAVFAAGGRIFKSDAQGNRDYYSDEEIQEQLALTKAVMDSVCVN